MWNTSTVQYITNTRTDAPHITTHRSEVVPDIAETLTAWVVPAVRDRQSLTTHSEGHRCEAVHDTKAGGPLVSEKRLYAGTEGKVPREGSCGYCGWPAVTAHDHFSHMKAPH